MLEEYKKNYSFDIEGENGEIVEIHVEYYYPGTNFHIHSASLEPNDSFSIEYTVYLVNEDGLLGKQVYDDDGIYDPYKVEQAIHYIEAKEGY